MDQISCETKRSRWISHTAKPEVWLSCS